MARLAFHRARRPRPRASSVSRGAERHTRRERRRCRARAAAPRRGWPSKPLARCDVRSPSYTRQTASVCGRSGFGWAYEQRAAGQCRRRQLCAGGQAPHTEPRDAKMQPVLQHPLPPERRNRSSPKARPPRLAPERRWRHEHDPGRCWAEARQLASCAYRACSGLASCLQRSQTMLPTLVRQSDRPWLIANAR